MEEDKNIPLNNSRTLALFLMATFYTYMGDDSPLEFTLMGIYL